MQEKKRKREESPKNECPPACLVARASRLSPRGETTARILATTRRLSLPLPTLRMLTLRTTAHAMKRFINGTARRSCRIVCVPFHSGTGRFPSHDRCVGPARRDAPFRLRPRYKNLFSSPFLSLSLFLSENLDARIRSWSFLSDRPNFWTIVVPRMMTEQIGDVAR